MFVFEKKPKSILSEAYRILRTNIQYSSFDKDIKTILITSSEPGEGKSTVAGNLSLSLAEDGKKVILLDCDLRKPSIHRKFNITNIKGLSEVLVGKEKLLDSIHRYNKNLHILTSGKIPPNPSEMLGSKLMKQLLDELKTVYDYIIIDSAPIIALTDGQILAAKTDGVVLVTRAGMTKKNSIINAKKALKKVNGNIVGAILNGVDEQKNNYNYYYGEHGEKNK